MQMIVLFQPSAIPMTWKALLKSQPVIRTPINLLGLTYRPVSILSNLSKIFEQCIFRQLYNWLVEFLSKYQCGFRKRYSTQHFLLAMLEKWKSAVDKGNSFVALLTDLSNAFDCLSQELLFAKHHAYGFSIVTLRLIHSNLTNRKQRTEWNLPYSP